MTNRILEPFERLFARWRAARAMAHLDSHLREDAGMGVNRTPWDEINITKHSFWTGRREK